MKVAIMTRLTTEKYEEISEWSSLICDIIKDKLHYNINDQKDMVFGIHRLASKPHTHLHIIADASGQKHFKELSQKIKNYPEVKEFKKRTDIAVAISFNYDDGEKDKNGYMFNKDKILQYPLKEYATDELMHKDLKSIGSLNWKIRKPLWVEWRKKAYDIFSKTQIKQEEKKKDKREKLYEYIGLKINDHNAYWSTRVGKLTFPEMEKREILYLVETFIIDWNIENDFQFNSHLLKNQALNFLRKDQLFSNHDVIEFSHACPYIN